MKTMNFVNRGFSGWCGAIVALALSVAVASAATHNVSVSGLTFSPKELTVAVGDTVTWTGLASFHTVTPNTGVSEPFCGNTVQASCTVTFQSAGSFAYHCNPHQGLGMTGVVKVAAVNVPPVVTITNPASNLLFSAPATVPVGVTATDSDGTISTVQLLTNGVLAATSGSLPFAFTLTNLPAGNYTLRARATDNQLLSATSAPVNIRVAPRPALVFERGTNELFQFRYPTVTGVNYVVEGATDVTSFSALATNAGNGATQQFTQTNPAPVQRYFRIRLE